MYIAGNNPVFQIVSGIRTDDIAASAILHRFIQLSKQPVALPFFIDRTANPLDCRHLFKPAPGFRRMTVGISLDAPLFTSLKKEGLPFPVYWDNRADSLRYRGLSGCSVTSGESIASSVALKLKKTVESGTNDWMDTKNFHMFISEYTGILNLLVSSMNLQTFLRNTKGGYGVNALPYIYAPSQIFTAIAYSPGQFAEMLNSETVSLYLEESKKRIQKADRLIVPIPVSKNYRVGCVASGKLMEPDYENACASYLRYGENADEDKYDAIALVVWDPFVSGQATQVRLRTLRSEAGEIAEEIERILGRRNIRIEKESKNRVNVHIRNLKDRFAGKEKVISRIIVPAIETAYSKRIEDISGVTLLGDSIGYKKIELKPNAKAEKIKKARDISGNKFISGGLAECLETARQDRSADF